MYGNGKPLVFVILKYESIDGILQKVFRDL